MDMCYDNRTVSILGTHCIYIRQLLLIAHSTDNTFIYSVLVTCTCTYIREEERGREGGREGWRDGGREGGRERERTTLNTYWFRGRRFLICNGVEIPSGCGLMLYGGRVLIGG